MPDGEAADIVRLIYSLAVEGRRSVEIAQMLNAQGIPSPSVYKIRNGWGNTWTHRIDPDYCFWTGGVVYKLIKNEVYIGKAISNRFKVTQVRKFSYSLLDTFVILGEPFHQAFENSFWLLEEYRAYITARFIAYSPPLLNLSRG